MGLESTSYIDGLVVTNPIGPSDNIADGDNHLRLLKTVLKTTFAGSGSDVYSKAVTVGPDVLNTQSKRKLDATTAPTVDNDNTEGYGVGSVWLDVTNDVAYLALDVSTGSAVWFEFLTSDSDLIAAGASSISGFYTEKTADQGSVATSTWTTVTFPAATYDFGSEFAANAFVPGTTGEYLLTWSVVLQDALLDGDLLQTQLYKDGTTIIAYSDIVRSGAGSARISGGAAIVRLTAAESVVVRAWHDLGSNASIDGNRSVVGAPTFFSAARLS
jgi:hypothetical protein